MCGIAGWLSGSGISRAVLGRMTDRLSHRGPDDAGLWIDDEAGVGLGHRRLSILDLSAAGHQPMVSLDGRYVLTFNGEIYNHVALRAALEQAGASGWRGRSDSETLLAAIARWGIEAALSKSVGMFGVGLWDRHHRKLFLARDRFGEKPLYYGRVGGDFVFASELKAFRAHPAFAAGVDRRALRLFAARGYVPAPLSIYEGIGKLEPGTILTVDGAARAPVGIARYWSYRDVVEQGLAEPFVGETEAMRALEGALIAAIDGQSVADVPVGAFLSGGVDSSLIAALWRRGGSRPVRTYSIGFEETAFDEAPWARKVADRLGTDHRELYLSSAEARAVIPLLPNVYDEPLADPSAIPTYLMSKLAREEVKVVLSGDGGDELFGGYTRYATAATMWRRMRRVPRALRRSAGFMLGGIPARAWDGLAGLAPAGRRPAFAGARLQRTFDRLRRIDDLEALYRSFRDEWAGEPSPVVGEASDGAPGALDFDVAGPDLVRLMYCDAVSYLPGDLLCKVDRAAMAHGLEVRIPFLDHRVAEVAARIPPDMKMRGGSGKLILRRLLSAYLPPEISERPKAGFSVPIGAWLKGPLKSWAEDMLARVRRDGDGYFHADRVQRRWRDHLAGRRDASLSLWPVLMFEAWNQEREQSGSTEDCGLVANPAGKIAGAPIRSRPPPL